MCVRCMDLNQINVPLSAVCVEYLSAAAIMLLWSIKISNHLLLGLVIEFP